VPIFEYLCPACNRIYSFLSLAPSAARQPVCPKCGAPGLTRVPSAFAVAGRAKEKPETPRGSQPDEAALSRMESEVMRMADGLDEKDAENPRVMARMMRRMAEASGEPMTPTMDEMFRRLEAGEDPDALEEELGPQLEAETGAEGEGGGAAPTHDDGLYGM
jgi:putative FmdB family regulatory protein